MAGKYHTVILVPHARAKLRKLRISTTQVRVVAATVAVATLGACFVTWAFFRTNVDLNEIVQLREENEGLREINQSFEDSIRTLQHQLASYEERTRQLAIVAGLESIADQGTPGIGGAPTVGDPQGYDGFFRSIESQAAEVEGRLEAVAEKLDERQRWVSAMPAISPVKGILTSGYGMRRDPMHGRRDFHPGVDIAAPKGRPVRATADGVIVRSERIGGLGKAVYVAHGFGLTTRYGHLSELKVEAGERVSRGDVIGLVGNTGRSTGYHVHYEVRLDDDAVNPLTYILDR